MFCILTDRSRSPSSTARARRGSDAIVLIAQYFFEDGGMPGVLGSRLLPKCQGKFVKHGKAAFAACRFVRTAAATPGKSAPRDARKAVAPGFGACANLSVRLCEPTPGSRKNVGRMPYPVRWRQPRGDIRQASFVLARLPGSTSRKRTIRAMPNTGLRRKYFIGAALGLTALSLVLLTLVVLFYQHQLTQERGQAAAEVNRLLQSTLENAMLKRDLPGLAGIIEKLGHQPGIHQAMIVAPGGEVRFASNPALLGQRFPLHAYGLCPQCLGRATASGQPLTFSERAAGIAVVRSINPVANKAPCSICHGPPTVHPVNGILVVDYDAAPIRQRAVESALVLAGMGVLLLAVTLAGGSWFIHRHVLQPVGKLAAASRDLENGHLDARVSLPGDDELARLGETFNRMATSIAEQMRTIQDQKQFLQALIDAFPDGIRVIDPVTFRIVADNRAYRVLIGQAPEQSCRGQTCHASSHGRAEPCPPTLMLCPLHEIGRTGEPCKTLMTFRRADGTTRQVEVFAAPVAVGTGNTQKRYVVESCRDLAQVVAFSQEQKLAEMAQLATGVAHEIHNPLASVRLALNAMLREADVGGGDPAAFRQYLELVDGEIDRCIEITGRLLKLGAAPASSPQLVDVNQAVADTLQLLAWDLAASHVQLETVYARPSPRVFANDSELRMVILNLAQNAIHAMPGGGALRVSTARTPQWVQIIAEDTGVGIDPADQPHVFEPFFSRRADGSRGTGLGLSICLSVVQNHGGRLYFTSEPKKGSRFVVELPDPERHLDA
jgi:signal transduction histidine kinase/HAMP domain-containing protein